MEDISSITNVIKDYYIEDDGVWIIGFSGGKDSSLVTKLVLSAIKDLPSKNTKPIKILYCDTGVEIPIFKDYISWTLRNIEEESKLEGIVVSSHAVRPKIDDHFFVKVIGRGYHPPTNKFRWCTDKLRINPIQVAIREAADKTNPTVILGTRYDESGERDKILSKYSTNKPYIFRQAGYSKTKLFCPIANFKTDDVWDALSTINFPTSIDINRLSEIYKKISNECPIIRLPNSNPCSNGRFGCWTCTVIRKDKATRNLISNGHINLKPLLDFRDWLIKIRDKSEYRCSQRRNGVKGLGPFRLSARKKILDKLLDAQAQSGFRLIRADELLKIEELWGLDSDSDKYFEDWRKGI